MNFSLEHPIRLRICVWGLFGSVITTIESEISKNLDHVIKIGKNQYIWAWWPTFRALSGVHSDRWTRIFFLVTYCQNKDLSYISSKRTYPIGKNSWHIPVFFRSRKSKNREKSASGGQCLTDRQFQRHVSCKVNTYEHIHTNFFSVPRDLIGQFYDRRKANFSTL